MYKVSLKKEMSWLDEVETKVGTGGKMEIDGVGSGAQAKICLV